MITTARIRPARTSSPASQRPAEAIHRTGAAPAAVRFYTEHAEAEAVHGQAVRHHVVGGLLQSEHGPIADVVFGIRATIRLEDRLAAGLLTAWREGVTALRADERRAS